MAQLPNLTTSAWCELHWNMFRQLKFDQCPDYVYLYNLFDKLIADLKQDAINDGRTDLYKYKQIIINLQSLSFIGARLSVASQRKTISSKRENVQTNMHDVNESKEIDINSIHKLNKEILSKYNEGLFEDNESNVTKMNYMTHMSVHGLKNRFGFYINSLIISKGVPKNKPCIIGDDYGGIIVFKPIGDNNNKLEGYIYMWSGKKCHDTNEEYWNKNNKTLKGQIHGAIYYYFGQNVHMQENSDSKLKFIRGFGVYGGKNNNDCKFEFKSGAFNRINLNFKDKKYHQVNKISCILFKSILESKI